MRPSRQPYFNRCSKTVPMPTYYCLSLGSKISEPLTSPTLPTAQMHLYQFDCARHQNGSSIRTHGTSTKILALNRTTPALMTSELTARNSVVFPGTCTPLLCGVRSLDFRISGVRAFESLSGKPPSHILALIMEVTQKAIPRTVPDILQSVAKSRNVLSCASALGEYVITS